MEIKNIFSKDIFRPINGIVKADQQDEAIVWQELDEYVVTRELDQHFRKFFESYLNAIDSPQDPAIAGRMGVWVSGFFGSGKSHFIKILSYLLGNREAHDPVNGEGKRAIDFFHDKIRDHMLFADIRRATQTDTDVILFNIDSKANVSEGRSAILSVFWRVFNEMQGFCADYPHIAELERRLSSEGKFEEFCRAFKDSAGAEWTDDRDGYLLRKDEVVAALSKTLGMKTQSAEAWFEKAEDEFRLTIEGLAKRIKEYLDSKGPDYRIIFLVDEVGQFIGDDTHLMLNLQTITEDLGRICQGRVWVVVTSQEDIDAVLGDIRASTANDFSKIQGRFYSRLSLSSSNADEVIQARLLKKTGKASAELENLFTEKGDILKNQLSFTFDSATLKNYTAGEDFVANYPFAPYHFQLVQKIFESIRKAGATGLHLSRGERSMLDAFQSAAQSVSQKQIGALVPLYEFYDTIQGFLDTAVKRSIDQAEDNAGLDKPFDIRLLRTLFLVRYVDIIKPNVDNLTTLCIDEVDADRLSIRQNIEAALERLERENLISRNGDLYFFLTNEEREVSREIKGIELTSAKEISLLSEIIFNDILKAKTKHRFLPNRRDYAFSRICDSLLVGTKVEQDLAVEVISPLFDEYSFFTEAKCVMHTAENQGHLFIKLPDHPDLVRELRTFLQTERYIRLKSDAATSPTLRRILSDRADENRQRKTRLVAVLDDLMFRADYYALGTSLENHASSSRKAFDDSLDYLVLNIYSKFGYLKSLCEDPQKEIKAVLLADNVAQEKLKIDLGIVNAEALKEIRTFVDLKVAGNYPVMFHELIGHFSKRPYGWPEWEIVLLTARLFMGGEIHFVIEGAKVEPKEAFAPLTKSGYWKTIKILKRKIADVSDLNAARKLEQDLFGSIGPEKQDDLFTFIHKGLKGWKHDLDSFEPLAGTGNYPGKKEIAEGLALLGEFLSIRDAYEFIKAFNKAEVALLDLSDDFHDLSDFYKNQIKTWETLRKAVDRFKPNQTALDKDEDASRALRRMNEILAASSPYKMLKEVFGLISRVEAVNDTMVEKVRKSAVEEVGRKIAGVVSLLDEKHANDDLRNKALFPLQEIKKKILAEDSMPNIAYQVNEAEEQHLNAFEVIDNALKPSDKDPKPMKKIKVINAASLASRIYMETEADVNEYVDRVRIELMDAVKNNIRVRIE